VGDVSHHARIAPSARPVAYAAVVAPKFPKSLGIQAWLGEAQLPNVKAPLALNVNDASWPVTTSVAIDCVDI